MGAGLSSCPVSGDRATPDGARAPGGLPGPGGALRRLSSEPRQPVERAVDADDAGLETQGDGLGTAGDDDTEAVAQVGHPVTDRELLDVASRSRPERAAGEMATAVWSSVVGHPSVCAFSQGGGDRGGSPRRFARTGSRET